MKKCTLGASFLVLSILVSNAANANNNHNEESLSQNNLINQDDSKRPYNNLFLSSSRHTIFKDDNAKLDLFGEYNNQYDVSNKKFQDMYLNTGLYGEHMITDRTAVYYKGEVRFNFNDKNQWNKDMVRAALIGMRSYSGFGGEVGIGSSIVYYPVQAIDVGKVYGADAWLSQGPYNTGSHKFGITVYKQFSNIEVAGQAVFPSKYYKDTVLNSSAYGNNFFSMVSKQNDEENEGIEYQGVYGAGIKFKLMPDLEVSFAGMTTKIDDQNAFNILRRVADRGYAVAGGVKLDLFKQLLSLGALLGYSHNLEIVQVPFSYIESTNATEEKDNTFALANDAIGMGLTLSTTIDKLSFWTGWIASFATDIDPGKKSNLKFDNFSPFKNYIGLGVKYTPINNLSGYAEVKRDLLSGKRNHGVTVGFNYNF